MPLLLANETDAGTDRLGITSAKFLYHALTLSEALTEVPEALLDIPLIDRQARQLPCGKYGAYLNYEGILPGVEPTADWFELEGSTAEEPIESHPRIEKLMTVYGGEEKDGRVQFPSTLTNAAGETVQNELFGASVWYTAGLVWTRSMVSKEFPETIVNKLGKIDEPPSAPGKNPPTLSGKRNWIKVRAIARWRGNIWQINESWLLSDDGGWNEDVYGNTED